MPIGSSRFLENCFDGPDMELNLAAVISWLENGCDPKEAAKELKLYQSVMHPTTRRTDTPEEVTSTDELGQPPMLLLCPFCGKPPRIVWRRTNPRGGCETSGCLGSRLPVLSLDMPDDVTAWNTRSGLA